MATIRKQHGHYLEDFRPGQLLRHKGGKTITEGLFAVFTDFSMTTNPLSKNVRYARAYGFRGLVAPPGLVMNVVFSQSVEDVSENARANLEYIDVRFGVPVCVGDTIEAESLVLGVKPSSRDRDVDAPVADAAVPPRDIPVSLALPPYDPARPYRELAYLSSPDTYLEDFRPGDVFEHVRGRVVTTDHIMLTGMLDNTSQVHCNQWMIDQDPERYVGGQLIVFGGIPFNLCLGISSADVADNALADVRYATGRHTAPVFAGDTVFASTEIREIRDFPGRPDLGILVSTLRGHKFVRRDGQVERVQIFELEREQALKRRSHYA